MGKGGGIPHADRTCLPARAKKYLVRFSNEGHRDQEKSQTLGSVQTGGMLERTHVQTQRAENAMGDTMLQKKGRDVRHSETVGEQSSGDVDETTVAHVRRQTKSWTYAVSSLGGVETTHSRSGASHQPFQSTWTSSWKTVGATTGRRVARCVSRSPWPSPLTW